MKLKEDMFKDIEFTASSSGDRKDKKKKTSLKIGTEDIIAVFSGFVAIIFAVAMIAHWVPIDKYTVGLASFSAAGAVVAQIIKLRRSATLAKPQPKKKNK